MCESDGECCQAFGGRGYQSHCRLLPRGTALLVAYASPKIDDLETIAIRRAGSAELASRLEVVHKHSSYRLETRGDLPIDSTVSVRMLSIHGFHSRGNRRGALVAQQVILHLGEDGSRGGAVCLPSGGDSSTRAMRLSKGNTAKRSLVKGDLKGKLSMVYCVRNAQADSQWLSRGPAGQLPNPMPQPPGPPQVLAMFQGFSEVLDGCRIGERDGPPLGA
jgi:hypothetical protein